MDQTRKQFIMVLTRYLLLVIIALVSAIALAKNRDARPENCPQGTACHGCTKASACHTKR